MIIADGIAPEALNEKPGITLDRTIKDMLLGYSKIKSMERTFQSVTSRRWMFTMKK